MYISFFCITFATKKLKTIMNKEEIENLSLLVGNYVHQVLLRYKIVKYLKNRDRR